MKIKYYAISTLFIFTLMTGLTLAEVRQADDNTGFFSLVDEMTPTPSSPANGQNNVPIQGKNAAGETQTTVVDQNGNLKMIDNKAVHPVISPTVPQQPNNAPPVASTNTQGTSVSPSAPGTAGSAVSPPSSPPINNAAPNTTVQPNQPPVQGQVQNNSGFSSGSGSVHP